MDIRNKIKEFTRKIYFNTFKIDITNDYKIQELNQKLQICNDIDFLNRKLKNITIKGLEPRYVGDVNFEIEMDINGEILFLNLREKTISLNNESFPLNAESMNLNKEINTFKNIIEKKILPELSYNLSTINEEHILYNKEQRKEEKRIDDFKTDLLILARDFNKNYKDFKNKEIGDYKIEYENNNIGENIEVINSSDIDNNLNYNLKITDLRTFKYIEVISNLEKIEDGINSYIRKSDIDSNSNYILEEFNLNDIKNKLDREIDIELKTDMSL